MPVTPLQAAIDVLDRAQGLLSLDPGGERVSLVQYDVRRQAHAMAVAALDTWMHWSLRKVDLDNLSRRLYGLEIPFGTLVDMGDHSTAARSAGIADRPRVRARNALNEKLLTMTFQNARQWDYGFDLLGIRSGMTKTGRAMNPAEPKASLETRLNSLSRRRNRVVHEGDLVRKMRPQTVKREKLLRPELDDDIAWVRRFLTAVDTVR